MFTGIIEEIGTVRSSASGAVSGRLSIAARTVLEGTRIGDSISVNGVCLTVTDLDSGGFTADVMPETLRRSNLGMLKNGDKVNLERAMSAEGRFGGHIVSGHIDGTGRITETKSERNAVWVTVRAEAPILSLIVEKGSIAIDGISLTVAKLGRDSFSVSVIPHTSSQTTLLSKRPGDSVNLENDIIGKYVRRLMSPQTAEAQPESRIDEAFLARNGFI